MCARVCVCVCVCVCVFVYLFVCLFTRTQTHVRALKSPRVHTHRYVRAHVCVLVCACEQIQAVNRDSVNDTWPVTTISLRSSRGYIRRGRTTRTSIPYVRGTWFESRLEGRCNTRKVLPTAYADWTLPTPETLPLTSENYSLAKEGNTVLYVHRNHQGLLGTGKLGGSGIFISNTYSLHCHHQNDSALRWAAVWDIIMFHWLCGQSHKTVSINHNFFKTRRAEADRTEVLLRTSLAPYH